MLAKHTLIACCLMALAAPFSPALAHKDPHAGLSARERCVVAAHKVLSQREATKYMAKHYAKLRPSDLKAHGEWAENLLSEPVIMPEEYRAQLIRANIAKCPR